MELAKKKPRHKSTPCGAVQEFVSDCADLTRDIKNTGHFYKYRGTDMWVDPSTLRTDLEEGGRYSTR